MAASKKSYTGAAGKKKASGPRCWEGYEPTTGNTPGTKGSCKPKD